MLKTPIPPNASVTETREPITQQKEFEKALHFMDRGYPHQLPHHGIKGGSEIDQQKKVKQIEKSGNKCSCPQAEQCTFPGQRC